MKVLVTGSSGQLGTTLLEEFPKSGIKTIAAPREVLDITDLSALTSFIVQNNPTHIVNCAAWTNVEQAEHNLEQALLINSEGAANVAKVAYEFSIRLIHISTDYVFGKSNRDIYFEDHPTEPMNVYGQSKALGESKIFLNCPNSIILRVSWLYSPFGRNFVKSIVHKLLLDDNVIKVVSDQYGQPTSCKSASKTIIQLLNRPDLFGIFHGSSQGITSRFEQARLIAKLTNHDLERIHAITNSDLNTQVIRPQNSVLGHTRQITESIELPLPWEEDLARDIDKIITQVRVEM